MRPARRPHAAALPTLEGDGIQLGPWLERDAAADAAALVRLHADPRAMRYWSSAAWSPEDLRRAQAFLDDVEAGARSGKLLRFAARRPGSPALVGWVTLFHIEPPRPRTEMGYLLDPALWGQGLGRRMVGLALDHAFGAIKVHKVEAEVDPENAGSCRLLDALGFRRDGPLRQGWRADGEPHDTAIYRLAADEWPI